MYSKPTLALADARAILEAARSKALEQQWNVVITVVDEGGHLLVLERMDDTQLGSIQVAQDKARTALLFRRPSKMLEDTILGGRVHMLALPGATPVEGGVPLLVAGHLVGAIGVSGVKSFEDGQVAQAGADFAATLVF